MRPDFRQNVVKCPICETVFDGIPVSVPEMVKGTRELFHYLECSGCGLVWLSNPPADVKKYYENYYSLLGLGSVSNSLLEKIFVKITEKGFRNLLTSVFRRGIMRPYSDWAAGRRIRVASGVKKWESSYEFGVSLNACALFGLGLNLDHRILDYGSGKGDFVEELFRFGFINSFGLDPFVEKDTTTQSGGKILSGTLDNRGKELGAFDLITLNHSFEHVPNPVETASILAKYVKPSGVIVLRFPNVNSLHFKQYGADWWGFHAPRHYFFHTQKSLEKIFSPLGFKIEHVKCDSCFDHYLYSQEYALGIPDNSVHSFRAGKGGMFLDSELNFWKKKAKLLNKVLLGDWVVYYLRKVN